ncbi:beta-N-acetylhexosaminidase [Carboxylicivirga linearis]|uniref:beta-N-acetylhexosaminidase n=1 Tax=Carboxylicivirga linearis TaxID=1628157 RepID=A0ABS5K232_9BACT|nr:beta-N-acetylhexosaminidase [Carboxylicivirga linearis]MBS2100734.1 beta-N-acetylhexosaminidase [Carboxylicivirga linearis]
MKKFFLFALITVALASCCQNNDIVYQTHVIPEPNNMEVVAGRYTYDETPKVSYEQDKNLGEEEYKLEVTKKGVTITYATDVAKMYAEATLSQLQDNDGVTNYMPLVKIDDKPRFKHRGFMLDEARHFQGMEFVKKTLDRMAFHKLNKFHWHLSDDQGWRIEIKKYPLLTEKGSIRKGTQVGWKPDIMDCPTDGVEYGKGYYYTQEQIKEVIEYAAKLGIDVIPEIDMPGHMMAALHAYPELGPKRSYEVRQYWGVSHDVLDVSNPKTLQFAKDVISEVCDLFPYHLIHIGGDECPKEQWEKSASCQKMIKDLGLKNEEELQSWFLKEIEKTVNAKGKQIAGWDEILDGDMSKTATVYHWRFWTKENMTKVAAERGNEVVSTLNHRMYFDFYVSYDKEHFEPLAFPYATPLHKTYNYDPIPADLDPKYHDKVIGVQGNLWTEYVTSNETAEMRIFPRFALLSEVAWTNQDLRDWENMNRKLPYIFKVYDSWKLNYNRVYIATDCEY